MSERNKKQTLLVRGTMSTLGENSKSVPHGAELRSWLPFIYITGSDSGIRFKWLHLQMLIGGQRT